MPSNLLISEPPLQVLPSLSCKVGFNEALVLQQIHYWLNPDHNKNIHEGRRWVYNTIEEWATQFPFWSEKTLRRALQVLVDLGLIIRKNFNRNKFDKTFWYTINYDVLSALETKSSQTRRTTDVDNLSLSIHPICPDRYRQNDHMEVDNLATSIWTNCPLLLQEINQETTHKNSLSLTRTPKTDFLIERDEREMEMLKIWNEVVLSGKKSVPLTRKRKILLREALQVQLENNLQNWHRVCENVTRSKFLMGESKGSNFKAHVDWVCSRDRASQILEGHLYGIGDREQSESRNKYQTSEYYNQQITCLPEEERVLAFRRSLLSEIGSEAYSAWFVNTQAFLRDKTLILETLTGFAVERIERDFRTILDTLGEEFNFLIKIKKKDPPEQGSLASSNLLALSESETTKKGHP